MFPHSIYSRHNNTQIVAICTVKLKGTEIRIFATSYIPEFREMFKNNLWFRRKN